MSSETKEACTTLALFFAAEVSLVVLEGLVSMPIGQSALLDVCVLAFLAVLTWKWMVRR